MKLAIETFVLRNRFDDETAIKMIKDAGFDAYDYSMYEINEKNDMLGADYKEKASRLREFADKIGIECNQAHAPYDIQYTDELNISNERYVRLVRSIEAAAILGAKNIVVHAIKNNLPDTVDFKEYNRKFYTQLIPYCEKFKICVSVENLFNCKNGKYIPVLGDPEEHMDFVKSFDSEYLNICVDVGHSALTGYNPAEVILKMDSDFLKALHIHDNDCTDDSHMLPYMGSISWESITYALKTIGYNGDFNFEAVGFLGKMDVRLLGAGLKFAQNTGRMLISEITSVN